MSYSAVPRPRFNTRRAGVGLFPEPNILANSQTHGGYARTGELEMAGLGRYGQIPSPLTPLASGLGGILTNLLGGGNPLTPARVAALQSLLSAADLGNRNAAQQLYNWAFNTGSQYPHGNEPTGTLSAARAAWNAFASAHPSWAALIGPGGAQGDPILDPGGPSLPGAGLSNALAPTPAPIVTPQGTVIPSPLQASFLGGSILGFPSILVLGGIAAAFLMKRRR